MNKTLYKAGAIISTLSLLTSTFSGLVGAEVTGTAVNDTTGADSDNDVSVQVEQSTFVDQSNEGEVVNEINLSANTGNNSASKNTGEGTVVSGDVSTGVGVSNSLNLNVADVEACGGCDYDLWASNEKTGADSDNDAAIDVQKNTTLQQENTAKIYNLINQDLNTGDNKADKNTGSADIKTGDIESLSIIENAANKNVGAVSGGAGAGAVLTATNDTTGFNSDNDASIAVEQNNWAIQSNVANIVNEADLWVNTGWNRANKNTGLADIETGDIDTGVGFSTEANSNFLAWDGCCDVELGVGNHKTGADSDNDSTADLVSTNTVFQANCDRGFPWWGGEFNFDGYRHGKKCGVTNLVYGDLNTGENKTNKNTADGVVSGDVEAAVEVSTTENENVLGDSGLDWPDVEFGELDGSAWWLIYFGINS